MNNILQKNFVMSSGERYSLLINGKNHLPLYFPNLYVTTQVRNRSLSFSTMEKTLSCISVLLRFMDEKNENIEQRIKNYKFLDINELDAIRDYCFKNFYKEKFTKNITKVVNVRKIRHLEEYVCSQTAYVRMTVIAHYIKWLTDILIVTKVDNSTNTHISSMIKGLLARRPHKASRNNELKVKGLNSNQIEILFEIIRPKSEFNPFENIELKIRNRLIILILFHLAIRRGELLNIRIRDIDFDNNLIFIKRRADENDDPRLNQPLVKTLDRLLPLKDTLVQEINNYILTYRKKVIRPKQPDYLFVTHKKGPTVGLPLSISSYSKILRVVRKVSPDLYKFTGHQLRHTWNERFSELMDSMDEMPSEEKQEQMRSSLMGWNQGSGTSATYNKRFVRKKSIEASLQLQDGFIRLPKGSFND